MKRHPAMELRALWVGALVFVAVSAPGGSPGLNGSGTAYQNAAGGPTPLATPTPPAALRPRAVSTGDLGNTTVAGVVYDASHGRDFPIAGAVVTFQQFSLRGSNGHGSVVTSSDGSYRFELRLYDSDSVTIDVEAPGFTRISEMYFGFSLYSGSPRDFGLQPIGTVTPTSSPTTSVTSTTSVTPTATPPSLPCVGSCNGDSEVSVDELIQMVNIALGDAAVSTCTAGDANGDGMIGVNEIVAGVNNALSGCPLAVLCSSDSDCPFGTRCQANLCAVVEPCTRGVDCSSDRSTCVGGVCSCAGDCNLDGRVTATEVGTAALVYDGIYPVSACAAADMDGDGMVTQGEIEIGVMNFEVGCPGKPVPLSGRRG